MTATINRPPLAVSPGQGLMRHEHFQMAYATTDLTQAKALFLDRFGIREWKPLEGQTPAGGHIRIELAWCGGLMYELVRTTGPGSEVFNRVLPVTDGFALRHHHLGYLVKDVAAWEALHAEIGRSGCKLLSNSNNVGFLRACIIEVPELNHCLEYICPEPAGVAFFESVPRN